VALVLVLAARCAAPPFDPATINRSYGPDDELAARRLTPAGQAEVVAAMREAFSGQEREVPTPALHGVRWSDVGNAAYWAGLACEMAIIETIETPDQIRFTFQTIDDARAELIVDRLAPPLMLACRAQVGLMGERRDDAERLEAEFRKALEGFGRKHGWE